MSVEVEEDAGEITLKRKLVELNTFLGSWMHEAFVSGLTLDVQIKEREIVEVEPADRKSEIESYKLRGDLRTIQSFFTLFEEARDNLEDRLDQIEIDKISRENLTNIPNNENE